MSQKVYRLSGAMWGATSAGAAFHAMPPIEAYEAVVATWSRSAQRTNITGSALRRLVRLRRAGDNFADIARALGRTRAACMAAYSRLPEELR